MLSDADLLRAAQGATRRAWGFCQRGQDQAGRRAAKHGGARPRRSPPAHGVSHPLLRCRRGDKPRPGARTSPERLLLRPLLRPTRRANPAFAAMGIAGSDSCALARGARLPDRDMAVRVTSGGKSFSSTSNFSHTRSISTPMRQESERADAGAMQPENTGQPVHGAPVTASQRGREGSASVIVDDWRGTNLLAILTLGGSGCFVASAMLLPAVSEYGIRRDFISELAIGRYGFVQTLAFQPVPLLLP